MTFAARGLLPFIPETPVKSDKNTAKPRSHPAAEHQRAIQATDAPVDRAHTTDTQGGPTDLGRRAQQDVERGLADTSRAESSDETYARSFRSDPATPAHRRAPSGSRR
jgi:hypothetical protein